MVRTFLTVLGSLVWAIVVVAVFVLWTEYAYYKGVEHAMYSECEAESSDRQIN